mmetsp:Transcript_1000/g.3038  ORF Transcript_1000/g.3038 Transcript_1000/m.3038 type:complete len:406 (+) Transcript_1000:3481-4698(+)
MAVCARRRAPQVHSRAVLADDVARAGQVLGTVVHELLQALEVEGRHDLRVGERRGDGPRHAHLVDGQIRVRRDHCARAEVHALAHEVAAHAAVLALEALRDGLERAPRLGRRLTRHHGGVVGHERGVVELKELGKLGDDVLRGGIFLMALELVVGLEDVAQLVREVVLGPRRAREHARPHLRRRHGQHFDKEPLGPRAQRVQPHQPRVLICDLGEDLVASTRVHNLPVPHHALLLELKDVLEVRGVAADGGGLLVAAAKLFAAHLVSVAQLHHLAHAALGGFPLELHKALLVIGAQEARAVDAHRAHDLEHRVEEADVEDGPREIDVAEVARAVVLAVARLTDPLAVQCAKAEVSKALWLGPPVAEGLRVDHLHHGHLLQLIGRQHAKLHGLHLAHLRLRVREAH